MYTRFGLNHEFNSGMELVLKNANSQFDRNLEIPGFIFSGEQTSSFTELTLANQIDEGGWIIGINSITEDFAQDQSLSGFDHDYTEETLGAFGQYTHDLSSSVVLEGGSVSYTHLTLPTIYSV